MTLATFLAWCRRHDTQVSIRQVSGRTIVHITRQRTKGDIIHDERHINNREFDVASNGGSMTEGGILEQELLAAVREIDRQMTNRGKARIE